MLRWILLISTALACAAAVFHVQRTYGPRPLSAEALTGRDMLDSVFSDRAAERESWQIFVNPAKLSRFEGATSSPLNPAAVREWEERHGKGLERAEWQRAGARPGERPIGSLVNTLRHIGFARAEVHTVLKIERLEAPAPPLLQMLGETTIESTALLSRDIGLENFSLKASASGGRRELLGIGFREGDALKMTLTMYQDHESLGQHTFQVPVGDFSAPTLSAIPFAYRPSIHLGDKWSIAMLDTTQGFALAGAQAQFTEVEAEVSGQAPVMYRGQEVMAYEVKARRGQDTFTAYYSLEGHVLKVHGQVWLLPDATLVRDPADFGTGANPRP